MIAFQIIIIFLLTVGLLYHVIYLSKIHSKQLETERVVKTMFFDMSQILKREIYVSLQQIIMNTQKELPKGGKAIPGGVVKKKPISVSDSISEENELQEWIP